MELEGDSLAVKESGWYQQDRRVEDMKEDAKFKNFRVEDIFLDPKPIQSAISDDRPTEVVYSEEVDEESA